MAMKSETSNYNRILKYFCETTTIHGFCQLYGSKISAVKFIWACIIFSMFSCTIWLCAVSIQKYEQFDIKTTETYTNNSTFEFPSITFCNQFPGLRSILATNPIILQTMVTLLADKPDDVNQAVRESVKVCKSNKSSLYENTTIEDVENLSFKQIQQLFSLDSFRSVIKCWWAMKEFNCNGSFANHFTDRALCFSYVPNKMNAYYILLSDLNSMFYGVNEPITVNDRIVRSGTKSGLQLLLNVYQDEHCETARKYEGAGFQVIVHEPLNMAPTFSMTSHINLLPGYSQTIVLKPTVFTRKTENLYHHLCKKPLYGPKGKEIYFKNLCLQVCYLKRIATVCNCVMRQLFQHAEVALLEFSNFDAHSYRDCITTDYICIKYQQAATYLSENFQANCPECIQTCYETNYEFLVSKQKFSDHSLVNDFKFLPNKTNRSEIRKNFLFVNFVFDSLTVVRVVETQEFTIYDLFIYFGGVIGLFLGMSFMSIGEILQFTFLSISIGLRNVQSRTIMTIRVILKWVHNRMKKKTKVVQLKLKRQTEILHSS